MFRSYCGRGEGLRIERQNEVRPESNQKINWRYFYEIYDEFNEDK